MEHCTWMARENADEIEKDREGMTAVPRTREGHDFSIIRKPASRHHSHRSWSDMRVPIIHACVLRIICVARTAAAAAAPVY